MNVDKLIRMANQIATFFRPYPKDQAVKEVHNHLMAFWTPSMREMLLACAKSRGDELDPVVTTAILTNLPTHGRPDDEKGVDRGQIGEPKSNAG
jgi:formate dehydrogenase subunit delta